MTLKDKMAVQAKNEFAIKLMEVFNEEYLSNQHGCAEADLLRGDDGEPIYNKNGSVIFIDCDENKMTAADLIEWYNIIMLDSDSQNEITMKMRVWHYSAIQLGYITDDTKKSW